MIPSPRKGGDIYRKDVSPRRVAPPWTVTA
jgi:hypothetical protein